MLGSGARANAPPSSTRDELLNAVEIVKVWPSLVRLVPVVPTRARVCLACEPYDPMTGKVTCWWLALQDKLYFAALRRVDNLQNVSAATNSVCFSIDHDLVRLLGWFHSIKGTRTSV
eukprot:4523815-Pyramimonas_sp.AAC.1